MPDTIDKQRLLAELTPHGQEHLLAFWDRLTPEQQQSLARQIRAVDLDLIRTLARDEQPAEDVRAVAGRAGSPAGVRLNGDGLSITAADARQAGAEALRAGKVGVILVAGGQGTRLGFEHPKGMFPIGPVSQHSLFQIHVEKILARSRRYGVRIPLYVMTSPATHDETERFFAEKGRFGLLAEDLALFCQGTMPAVDARTGQILLERHDALFASPDGHGGMLAALVRRGILASARARGIEHFFYFQVDNPLVDIANEEFVGYHLLAGSEMTTQVIAKADPLEKVGNAVQVDGRMRVLEYSDLPDDVAQRRNADGSLAIWAGSIGVHAISAAFLARAANQADALPFHRASKKVPHVSASGEQVRPSEPNAVKFERFIFDLLPHARGAIVVEVDTQRCFAPLKNAPGAAKDTPEAVRAQLLALHGEWLEQAGATTEPGVQVEIGPLFALDAADVVKKVSPGTRFAKDTFLSPAP